MPDMYICRLCLARDICGLVGFVLMVFGFGMAFWSLVSAPPAF